MAAELKAGSGGLSRGWGKAWVFPHGLFPVFPRPHSGEVAHEAPSALRGRQQLSACPMVLQMPVHKPFSPLPSVLPSPTLNRVGMGLMLFPRRK